jgi:uncharacterized membrane protein
MRLISSRHQRRSFIKRVTNVEFFVLLPVTKVRCGARKTAISRDRLLVVVTVVVLCPLRICVISNGHLSVNFLDLFVTLDR